MIKKLTPMLNRVSKTTGSTQLGFRTMSSKVAFGEKNTPMTRPNGLIAGCACASGAGIDVVVAIEVPPPQKRHPQARYTAFYPPLRPNTSKISAHNVGAQHAAPQLERIPASWPKLVFSADSAHAFGN